jgi:hypothetical protein
MPNNVSRRRYYNVGIRTASLREASYSNYPVDPKQLPKELDGVTWPPP